MASIQRLLNPVYSHLDNGNPQKALKECDLILKKQSKKSVLPTSKFKYLITLEFLDKFSVQGEALDRRPNIAKNTSTQFHDF